MYSESIRSVLSSRSGISIRMEDEWIDLQQTVMLDIHRHYPMFANAQLQCGCFPYGVAMNNYLGWKACTVCFHLDATVILKIATVMVTIHLTQVQFRNCRETYRPNHCGSLIF